MSAAADACSNANCANLTATDDVNVNNSPSLSSVSTAPAVSLPVEVKGLFCITLHRISS